MLGSRELIPHGCGLGGEPLAFAIGRVDVHDIVRSMQNLLW